MDIVAWVRENWAWVMIAAVVALVLWALLRSPKKKGPPYERKGPLLTKTELQFYRALKLAVKDRWVVMAMVRIADLLKVRSQTPQALSWFNRIACKHIDFVLCDPDSMEPKAGIELDDASHQRPDRVERDKFVDEAFAAAKFPLVRIVPEAEYDVDAIRERIKQATG